MSVSAAPDPGASVQFSRDGTYQSHHGFDGIDFVLTAYPSKRTPLTHQWYPKGKKYFNWTFQAYDLNVPLRAKFAEKRKVYLDTVEVTSTLSPSSEVSVSPYDVSAKAERISFDPQPSTGPHGMLITSPKGALELRSQAIGSVPAGTTKVTLHFTLTAWIADTAGKATSYHREVVRDTVPIEIYPSTQTTPVQQVPVDAS